MVHRQIIIVLLALCLALPSSTRAVELLEADSVWLPEVQELYETDIESPSWLRESSDFVVVKGLAGPGKQSAMSVAIHKTILPRLMKMKDGPIKWTDWERSLAERQIQFQLEHTDLIVKRFEQPFYKMVDGERYDAFTREAILLDLSDENMTELRYRIQKAVRGSSRLRKSTVGVSVGILGAIFLACWFACTVLDRMTRGYYVGWLRLIAVTTFLVSAGLIVHVARTILGAI